MGRHIKFQDFWYEGLLEESDETRLKIYDAIFKKAFNGVDPAFEKGTVCYSIWVLIKKQVKASKPQKPSGRGPLTPKQRFMIFERDNFTCQYCGRTSPDVKLEVDHIVPQSKGGTNNIENLITACWDCNRGKRAHIIGEPRKWS